MDRRQALTIVQRVDEILAGYAEDLGTDLAGYRNHARRVAIFCSAFAPREPDAEEKIAIAAAFHDLGIWTAGTFDYLAPRPHAPEPISSASDALTGRRMSGR